MPSFANTDDLMKYIKTNTKDVIAQSNEGEIIEYECPYCKKVTEIEILKNGNGMCKTCKNEIEITWELND